MGFMRTGLFLPVCIRVTKWPILSVVAGLKSLVSSRAPGADSRGRRHEAVSGQFGDSEPSPHSCRSLGSNVSRNQSPMKFVARTVSRIAIPGKKETHQAVEM